MFIILSKKPKAILIDIQVILNDRMSFTVIYFYSFITMSKVGARNSYGKILIRGAS